MPFTRTNREIFMKLTSKYASGQFWLDTLDRAVATFAQGAVASLTAGVTGIIDVDFAQVGSIAGLAALVSVLTSIAFRNAPPQSNALANTVPENV